MLVFILILEISVDITKYCSSKTLLIYDFRGEGGYLYNEKTFLINQNCYYKLITEM